MNKVFRKSLHSMIGVGMILAVGTICVLPVSAESAQKTDVSVNVQVSQSYDEGINWENGNSADVVAIGTGLPPENAGVRGRVLARRAALVDAYRNLAEMLNGVQLDADTVMEDLYYTFQVMLPVMYKANSLLLMAEDLLFKKR